MEAKRSGGGNPFNAERLARYFGLVLLMAVLLGASGCASYSHAIIAKPHGEVSAKLQQHLTSGPRGIADGIYDLEQTVNRKVARFQFLENHNKGWAIKTDVFALPTDDGKTRVLVRAVRSQQKLTGWSETARKPDLEAKWLDRIKGLFGQETR